MKGPRTRTLQLADKKMMSCLYLCVCVRFLFVVVSAIEASASFENTL